MNGYHNKIDPHAPTKPAMRYHGGKFRLAPFILSFFPPHLIYTEVFGGAASVLLQKPRSYAEVYNDLDGEVVNFFRVLRDPMTRERLVEACRETPYARDEFDEAWLPADEPVERARRTAIRAQMGFGSAGATKGCTGFRTDTARAYTTAQIDWVKYPPAIAAAGIRFAGVLIENRPAVDVLRQHDSMTTLHFVDPPYMHETRVMRRKQGYGHYRHEMSNEQHEELLHVLLGLQGFVVLSGYATALYHNKLAGWRHFTKSARISAGRGTALREESVWINPACTAALDAVVLG